MNRFTHAARLAELVRQHHRKLPPLSDREAVAQLRPHGQGVQSAPQLAPLNTHAPEVESLDGARGEPVFDSADSTP